MAKAGVKRVNLAPRGGGAHGAVTSKFNVDWAFLTDLKERGRAIAEEWVGANYERIGVTSSMKTRELYDGTF